MRTSTKLVALLAACALASGCAVLPPTSNTVWIDDACGGGCGQGCGCVVGPSCGAEEWPVDPKWDKFDRCVKRGFKKAFRPDLGYEPPPAVPLTPAAPGRFFPVPAQPAFSPRDVAAHQGPGGAPATESSVTEGPWL